MSHNISLPSYAAIYNYLHFQNLCTQHMFDLHNVYPFSAWWEARDWACAWLVKCIPCGWTWRFWAFIGEFSLLRYLLFFHSCYLHSEYFFLHSFGMTNLEAECKTAFQIGEEKVVRKWFFGCWKQLSYFSLKNSIIALLIYIISTVLCMLSEIWTNI